LATVATDATLIANSIVANHLMIGGDPIVITSNTTAVPEPGTLVLLTLAGLALAGTYFRRKQ
jgi:hypothetical protein